jgi:hypothetical protein
MTDLPRSYMKVARAITGYWGTYLPSLDLKLGTIGRQVGGVFVKEGHISRFPEYEPALFSIDDVEQKAPTAVWNTSSVRMETLQVQADAPGKVVSAGVRLTFGAADEAAIICNIVREQSFSDLLALKDLMRRLYDQGRWDKDLCVVTEIISVASAWICFATASGQSAEIKASAPLSLPGDPLAALAAISGKGSLTASMDAKASSAFCATLPDGGTPLFRAMRFNQRLFGLLDPEIAYVRGGSSEFEEADFGAEPPAA